MNFKENESAQKLRGGYYTPRNLAHYMTEWALGDGAQSMLEPSCGDGVFLRAALDIRGALSNIVGVELESAECCKARAGTAHEADIQVQVESDNFLGWYLRTKSAGTIFDAVVGNPPFIRYQYLSEFDQELAADIFRRHDLKFTKHTNAWVPFVIGALDLLRPGGRLAMVLPAEILHVLHAQSLRGYIGRECDRIIVIDPQEIWFNGTLQGAVILLAEKKQRSRDHSTGLGIVRTSGNKFLSECPSRFFRSTNFINGRTVEGKWTKALLSREELQLYEWICGKSEVQLFSSIANVDVGIVTGANKFFLVPEDIVRKYRLEKWARPMFGRSEHCPGVVYNEQQHQANTVRGLPSQFLWFDENSKEGLTSSARSYIELGEEQGIHTRYKCRIRRPWFRVPSVYHTSVGMLKRSHDYPRLIHNQASALTTDTAYRISSNKLDSKKLVYCFVNSLTALSAELEGRHYGGGVLELVPSEIEKLRIPLPVGLRSRLATLDASVRSASSEAVLAVQDKHILGSLGCRAEEISVLNDAWRKLKSRRQRET